MSNCFKLILYPLLVFHLISVCYCARILCLFPIPSISHQIVFRPLTQELAKRGHELVIATTDPTYTTSPNIQEIDFKDAYQIWRKTMKFNKLTEMSVLQALKALESCLTDILEQQISHHDIQRILKNESEHFDLILAEYLVYPIAHAIRKKYNARLIGITSMDATLSAHKKIKNLVNPYLYPNSHVNSKLFTNTFIERIQRITENVFYFSTYSSIVSSQVRLINKYIGNFEVAEYQEDSLDLLFVNAHPALGYSKPVSPTFIDITGIHLPPSKPLPKDIQEFLDSGKNGVILFSLGTNVQSSLLTDEVTNVIFQTFSEMHSYKFICKWDFGNKNITLPDNVRTFKWIPQNDILVHPNMKMFIFQGGYQSLVEAVTHGIPMVGMPFSTDQQLNTQIVTHLGIGKYLNINELNKTLLEETLISIFQDKKYKENVVRLSKQLNDFPQTPLERAVWWTEYVLRNNGTKHIQPIVEDLYFSNFINVDIVILLCILLLIIFILIALVYISYKQFISAIIASEKNVNINDKKNK